jgi:hypothetical protein
MAWPVHHGLVMARHAHAFGAGALSAAVIAGLIAWLAPSGRQQPERRLAIPSALPAAARAVLAQRMARHGKIMDQLVWSMLMLDEPGAEEAADRLLAESPLARPLGSDATELNALLPDRFFVLQDQLRAQATALKAAAQSHDSGKVADAFGELSRGCVSCHQLYLKEVR